MAPDLPRIQLRVLGSLELCGPEKREFLAIRAQPKRLALLVYLVVARPRGSHRRDTLTGLFWPELDQKHARGALRKALQFVRRELGDETLTSRGEDEVGIDRAALWCDAVAFTEAVDAGRSEDALRVYRGDLLPGFFVADSPGFEQWLEAERGQLRAMATRAARLLRAENEAAQNVPSAVEWAHRTVLLAPDDERAWRELIVVLDRAGDRSGALKAYEDFARRLAADYEAEPSPETTALINEIRRREMPDGRVVENALARSSADRFAMWQVRQSVADRPTGSTLNRRITPRQVGTIVTGLAIAATMIAIARLGARPSFAPAAVQRQLTFTGNAQTATLSADGHFLAYVAQVGDSQNVVLQDLVAGSKPDTLYSSSNIMSVEWSPDGRKVLVASHAHPNKSAAILPRLGGPPRYLSFPEVSFARWLPDGSHVSLHGIGGRRVLIVDLSTGDTVAVRLPGRYTWVWDGAWSPDGRFFSVATESSDPLRWQIRTLTREGEMQIVAEDSLPLASPHWSSDGKYVYYSRASEAIWRVNISRTGGRDNSPEEVRRNLEALPVNFGALVFSTSRDGSRMAYGRGLRYSNIWLVAVGPTRERPRLTPLTRGTALRWSPVVSPNGKTLAYAEETNGVGELWRMAIGGGQATQITVGAQVRPRSEIAWATDGTRIAFETVRAGHGQIWIANVNDGSFQRFERTTMSTIYSHLSWAPGAHIAYLTPDHHDVRLLDPSSGSESVITGDTSIRLVADAPTRDSPTAVGSYIVSPRYSPDGRRLAVFWNRSHTRSGLWVFNLQNSQQMEIANRRAWPRGWSNDGRFVYAQFPTGGSTVYRIDTKVRRTPEPILQLPFREAQCSMAGKHRANTFVCVAFDFNSDIWMIDNFDSRNP